MFTPSDFVTLALAEAEIVQGGIAVVCLVGLGVVWKHFTTSQNELKKTLTERAALCESKHEESMRLAQQRYDETREALHAKDIMFAEITSKVEGYQEAKDQLGIFMEKTTSSLDFIKEAHLRAKGIKDDRQTGFPKSDVGPNNP